MRVQEGRSGGQLGVQAASQPGLEASRVWRPAVHAEERTGWGRGVTPLRAAARRVGRICPGAASAALRCAAALLGARCAR